MIAGRSLLIGTAGLTGSNQLSAPSSRGLEARRSPEAPPYPPGSRHGGAAWLPTDCARPAWRKSWAGLPLPGRVGVVGALRRESSGLSRTGHISNPKQRAARNRTRTGTGGDGKRSKQWTASPCVNGAPASSALAFALAFAFCFAAALTFALPFGCPIRVPLFI